MPIDQVRVFFQSAMARFFRQRFFHDRSAITKRAMTERSGQFGNPGRQFLQTLADHFVVITAKSVPGDIALAGIIQGLLRFCHRPAQVVQPDCNHSDSPRDQLSGPGSFQAMGFHICHFSVKSVCQPSLQSLFTFLEIDVRYGNSRESEFGAPDFNLFGESLEGMIVHLYIIV